MEFTPTVLYLLLWICSGLVYSATRYDKCNETVLVGDLLDLQSATLTLKMERIRKADRGKSFYCWFRFEGAPGQFVQVDVKDIRAGMYDGTAHVCDEGYLRISDQESCSTKPDWLPPTTICGRYTEGQVRVKRLTRSPVAFVEFKLDKAKTTLGYEFDVTFVNAAAELENESPEEDGESLPYGDLQRFDGKIANTKCDWLIPVETCHGFCDLVTPGYSGIYPPNTRCRYLLTNFEDERVELKLGGKGFKGKFDLKKSANCTEDYLSVYDGMSTLSPLIGRFCGQDGEHVVSSGSSLLLIFESGPGGPPWDYSGFKVQTTYRWKAEQEGGSVTEDTVCDWVFKSEDSDMGEGDVHTPDHRILNNTECQYRFEGRYNEKVEINIVINGVIFDPDCNEFLQIVSDGRARERICAANLTRGRNEFDYVSSSPNMVVKYFSASEKVSTPSPSWINYKFVKNPNVKGPPPIKTTGYRPEASEVVGGNSGAPKNLEVSLLLIAVLSYMV